MPARFLIAHAVQDSEKTSDKKQRKEIQPQHLRKVFELPAETYPIGSLTISPSDELIAYSIDRRKRSPANRLLHLFTFDVDKLFVTDTTLKIWNRRTNQIQAIVQDETVDGFYGVDFTSDGKTLVTRKGFSMGELKLWDAQTGKPIANLARTEKRILSSRLSPDGKYFAASFEDGTASLWSVPKGELIAVFGTPPKKEGSWLKRLANNDLYSDPFFHVGLYFSPDSRLLVTTGMDRKPKYGYAPARTTSVWDTATGQLKFTVSGSDIFSWMGDATDLFSPDGSIIATAFTERNGASNLTANSVKLWNSKDGSLLRTLDHARTPIRFSPDGKRLATGLVHWDDDGTWDLIAEIWNVETGTLNRRLEDSKGSLDEMYWTPDGHTLATTGGGKYTLTLWDAESGQQKTKIRLVRRHCFDPISDCISDLDLIRFSPDGHFLTATNQKSFRIIDVKTGSVLETIEGIGIPTAFLSSGELVTLSADKRRVVIWEIKPD